MTRPPIPGTLVGTAFGNPTNAVNGGESFRAVCNDSHGRPVVDSSFSLKTKDTSRLVPVNGAYAGGNPNISANAKNWIFSALQGPNSPYVDHWGLPTIPAASASMTTLLARTNPSRPDYVPLTLLQDLVDLPRMLKDVGRLITTKKSKLLNAREVANQHLGFQFGWKPLFQDIKDLLDVQEHIHRRVGELHRLYDQGGLKRRIRLGSWTGEYRANLTAESSLLLSASVDRSYLCEVERWGTVRWKPTVLPRYQPNDAELIRQAKQLVLGLSLESTLKGAWDVIPWTWLIGWFTNIGDYAMQYSNTVPARPSSSCVMTKTSTMCSFNVTSMTPGYTGGNGYATCVSKDRYVGAGTLDVHLPFIGRDRLAILGALFVQRFKR
jgi:hypothetical protein